jgi:NADH-quinone oxidoreductase subunit J
LALSIIFWILAVVSVGAALGVIMLRNVFRAALLLILSFLGIAGLFLILGADFLAAVQILIYVGAISVLLLMGIMLTREQQQGSPFGRLRWPAAIIVAVLLVTIVVVVTGTPWSVGMLADPEPTTVAIANSLFSPERGFVLPFEIASVLLLAAVVGAIVIVREK